MPSEFEIKKQICEIGKRIYDKGFIAANDGNISVKISPNEFLCTPTGVSKGFMTPDMICKVDANGNTLQAKGNYRPSSEIKMHMRVYKERPDVNSVVHAHPPYATSYAIVGIPLTEPIMPEAVIMLGCVPIAEYGTPSTDEIPNNVAKYLQHYDAVLLENHGALSYAGDLLQAYHKMESLEFYAQLLFISNQIGKPQELDKQKVTRLYQLRKDMGLPGKHPADICARINGGRGCNCHTPSAPEAIASAPATTDAAVVEAVVRKVLANFSK
ncbi:MAG: class II aldolase/adducin family protein [Defluviitaleaceae bacterium]|nr:class II aldolase/adducin family protein [Defluviitaleaceae bacterium]